MAILGAGPIAIEMAQAFNRLGTSVHILQRGDQILSREDRDMADLIMNELVAEGVHCHLHARVNEVRPSGNGSEVIFADGTEERQTVAVDTILIALGRTPNVDRLGLARIGAATDPNGLDIDQRRPPASAIFSLPAMPLEATCSPMPPATKGEW